MAVGVCAAGDRDGASRLSHLDLQGVEGEVGAGGLERPAADSLDGLVMCHRETWGLAFGNAVDAELTHELIDALCRDAAQVHVGNHRQWRRL